VTPATAPRAEDAPVPAGAPSLELRAVGKSFGNVHALSRVDFAAYPGEIHAIVGDNGAGKSTTLKIMCGIYRRDTGELRIDGTSVVIHDPSEAHRNGIAVVHQHTHPYASVCRAHQSVGEKPARFIAAKNKVLQIEGFLGGVNHLHAGQKSLDARGQNSKSGIAVMATSRCLESRTECSVFRARKREARGAWVMRAGHTCAACDERPGQDEPRMTIESEAGFRCRQVSAHHDIARRLMEPPYRYHALF